MDSQCDIRSSVRERAGELGFVACGFAEAAPVVEPYAASFRSWIGAGMEDCMGYMASNIDKRLDPTLLVPGARSVVVVALPYRPRDFLPSSSLQFACYAYGKDYHDVMRGLLNQLYEHLCAVSEAQVTGRVFCDTAPVLERYWAWRAGLGWIGKNCNLIIPHVGSFCFIGVIVCDVAFVPDQPMPEHCGSCTACLDACPSGALLAPHRLDARRCLSCQTIENRGPLNAATKSCLGNRIYGCDTCQLVCPWNKNVPATAVSEFLPSEEFMTMTPADWAGLTVERYRKLFKGSAVKRVKYEGLMRNIRAVTGGAEDTACDSGGK